VIRECAYPDYYVYYTPASIGETSEQFSPSSTTLVYHGLVAQRVKISCVVIVWLSLHFFLFIVNHLPTCEVLPRTLAI